MKDAVTLARVALLHPKIISDMTNFINELESTLYLKIRMVQGFRTFAEQDALYAQGRTKPGPVVTKSPAGASFHNYGLAGDLCPFTLDGMALDWKYDFNKFVPISQKYGFIWGGAWDDFDHFENGYSYGWRDLLHKYNINQFIPGTHFVQI